MSSIDDNRANSGMSKANPGGGDGHGGGPQPPKEGYFQRHWRGQHSLPRSFWLNYVLLSFVLIVILFACGFLTAVLLVEEIPGASPESGRARGVEMGEKAAPIIGGIWAIAVLWLAVGAYRSAHNYILEHGKFSWGTLVKIITGFPILIAGFYLFTIVATALAALFVEIAQ